MWRRPSMWMRLLLSFHWQMRRLLSFRMKLSGSLKPLRISSRKSRKWKKAPRNRLKIPRSAVEWSECRMKVRMLWEATNHPWDCLQEAPLTSRAASTFRTRSSSWVQNYRNCKRTLNRGTSRSKKSYQRKLITPKSTISLKSTTGSSKRQLAFLKEKR